MLIRFCPVAGCWGYRITTAVRQQVGRLREDGSRMAVRTDTENDTVETGKIGISGEFPLNHFRVTFRLDIGILFSPNTVNVVYGNLQRMEKEVARRA